MLKGMGMKDRKLGITSAIFTGADHLAYCAAVTPAYAEVTAGQIKDLYGTNFRF